MPNWKEIEERGARWSNIFAFIPAFYCAYVLWIQRHNGSGIPMSEYVGFWFSVGIFIVLIALGALLNFLRRDKTSFPQVSAEDEHKFCIQFPDQGQKMDYEAVWKRGSQSIELFLPLQLEAFQLSRELRLLVLSAGNKPRSDPNANEWDNTVGLWIAKLTHRYALDYGPRVKQLVHKFGMEGLYDEGLEIHAESVNSEQE